MIDFFTDPVLRAPTWGCMLLCFASSLVGVMIFLKKRSLLAETLSHAAYPGACLGVVLFSFLFPQGEHGAYWAVLGGAFISSLFALLLVHWLESTRVSSDAALCFVLALFFGVGIVVASGMQSSIPVWYQEVRMLLFGQAATMSDLHIWIYGGLALFLLSFLFLHFCPLQALLFDRDFSKSARIRVEWVEKAVFWFLVLSLVLGIRSVGVVLMSGMLVAPAVCARAFSDRLQTVFIIAGSVGAASGFLGNVFSFYAHIPTGPTIVLVGTAFALGGLLFAPRRGVCFRLFRVFQFRLRCMEENVLKAVWKKGTVSERPTIALRLALWQLKRGGWMDRDLQLTDDGRKKAALIIRLHRLWELYLTEELGFHAEKVHHTAEEMEHILTPDMEEKLTRLLENPKLDPHLQPIPEKEL
ncbi:MAG: hypothetical protein ACD_17C00001G0002 [uncultured bacterium]|nr:MAG: hypothetical protein ACD_17C00001G0002 [uncultured bacterium]OGN56087.1 MAG: hypothetical protein A2796_04085 [Chlamydiae bacterium RIFCSPHIGHO2_01_FULL_44_39]OGN60919.1 MAG: hypothetical protein A3D96_00080 [Chlamydiae bacterium RIFCSPHIGHO2_12_FULL_44_59]OGN66519.1 MAG: hypothetical protein A2978_05555 [Chlamydiae bacterium RIFCSPLOWO2_01_FULL_44_52]OGN69562.1 MAG: hypothetical protein A3I67_00975 [Chlamydiae bacterium RIFCSPLOWO2_02_FULL_45_22]OGN70838.1 MAG: hypothetical protein A3